MKRTNENDAIMLEQAIFALIDKMPWYAALVQGMKHVITRDISTLGVSFDPNGRSVRLTVNPDFLAACTLSERIALLIHEASHVDRLHLIRVPQATSNLRLGNIAADMAINCYIDGLPTGDNAGFYPKDFKLKNYQAFEYYLERLTDDESQATKPQRKPKGTGSGSSGDGPSEGTGDGSGSQGEQGDIDDSSASQATGSGSPQAQGLQGVSVPKRFVSPDANSIDVHDWENSELAVSDQAEVIENLMNRSIEKLGFDAGSIPAHVQESLRLLRELKTKRWHRELKRFLGRTVNGYELERTWSRRNRRFGLLEAGSKVSGQKKLAIAFDTSGSMSATELQRCLAETMAMVKTGVVGYLIQFDTQVNDIVKLTRSGLQVIDVKGRGGTNFVDVMEKIDELRCDGAVIFTDGEDGGARAEKPKAPVLWVYTHGMNEKYDWGFKTSLDENERKIA